MSNENDWTIPTNAGDYLRRQQKTLDMEARRQRVANASQLMGPALGPVAIQIENLNDDVGGTFNGMWIAAPGTLGAPTPTGWFAGYTIANTENGGYQFASTFRPVDTPHTAYERGWTIIPGSSGVRAYSDWTPIGGGSGPSGPIKYEPVTLTGVSPFVDTTNGSALTMTRLGDVVYASGTLYRPSGSSTSFTNATAAIPVGLRPSAEPADYLPPANPIWNTTYQWQFRIPISGGSQWIPQIRMTGASVNGMGLGLYFWNTNDSPGSLTPVP